jgi:FkbM family methyltransferase
MFFNKISIPEYFKYLTGVMINKIFKKQMFWKVKHWHHETFKGIFEVKEVYNFIKSIKGSFARENNTAIVNFTKYDHDFTFSLRRKTSDFAVFKQIFISDEYEVIFNFDKSVYNYILDAGANIGLATILFKKHFMNATILSVEPEETNFNCLKRNIELNRCENIIPLNCGIWYENTVLSIDKNFRDKREWSFTLKNKEKADIDKDTIPAFSINDLVLKHKFSKIDLLKIDIEGGEYFVFRENSDLSFLKITRTILMELHDDTDFNARIINILKENAFEISNTAEYIMAVNTKFNL